MLSCQFPLEVALNVAPLLHKCLNLSQRCENAVAGFVALDIFGLQAADKCLELGLPTGSCYMANQTVVNLQACSLACMVICYTKPDEMELWKNGHCRASELAIEQFFGILRNQSSTAQFGARGYWQASARHALKMQKQLQQQKAPLPGAARLTDQELLCQACVV